MTKKVVVGALVLGALGIAVVVATARAPEDEVACGKGYFPRALRCCVSASGACGTGAVSCPTPLVLGPRGCLAPPLRVRVPETTVIVGPSDWEAEGRVAPRNVHVASFEIDAFEAQVDELTCPSCVEPDAALYASGDPARAMGGLSLFDAREHCKRKGGRVPTDDEWMVAAAGKKPRRYPWGDTGAVCRRGAWGLVDGPCAHAKAGTVGPDTVGAHPDGDTELGLHDMAGNVAEWVEPSANMAVQNRDTPRGRLRGGSFATTLATELRTWAFRDVDGQARPEAGVRCAYDLPSAPAASSAAPSADAGR